MDNETIDLPIKVKEINSSKDLWLFYYNNLGWCGCGNPETVLRFLADYLDAKAARWALWRERGWMYNTYPESDWEAEKALFGSEPLRELVDYVLDHALLTEHGGGVGGAWLTPLGEQFRKMVRKTDFDWNYDDDFPDMWKELKGS